MKVYANENLEMSFISVNFSTLFYKRNIYIGNLVPHQLSLHILCTTCVSLKLKLSLYFFYLQAALVTNALIPTSIFVSYYCRMSSSDSEKGEIEISLDCGRRTQTATKRQQHGFSSIFIRKMKTQQ